MAEKNLDVTRDICPMTFVRTRRALDKLEPGSRLIVLSKGEEPRRNIHRGAQEHGHTVFSEETVTGEVTRLMLE